MRDRTRRMRFAAGALVAVMALFAAGCGDDDGGNGDASEEDEGAGGRDQEGQFDDLRASDDLGVDGDDDEGTDDEGTDDEETDDEGTDDEETDGDTGGDEYEDYVEVEDSTGSLTFLVPEEWSDVDDEYGGIPGADDEDVGVGVAASPDLDEFSETWDVPAILLSAGEFPSGEDADGFIAELLGGVDVGEECTFDDTLDYDDGFYVGEFDIYTDCGGTDTALVFLAAVDPDEEYFVAVVGQVLTEADLVAIDEAVLSSVFEA